MSENTNSSNNRSIDPEEFDNAFNKADESAAKLHSKISEGAQLAGYIRIALGISRKIYSALAIRSSEEPELIPIVQGAIDYVKNLTQELDNIESNVNPPIQRLHVFTSSAFTFTSSTGTFVDDSLLDTLEDSPFTAPPFLARDREEQAVKFDRIDESLGETYRGAWETYHGGKSDPLRGALYLMRQAFDHLFGVIAPDDEVRSSPSFMTKPGDEPDKVYRVERIQYASHKYIKDKRLAEAFSASAPQTKAAYDELNRAHARKKIDNEKATSALVTVSTFLEDFVSAMEFPSR